MNGKASLRNSNELTTMLVTRTGSIITITANLFLKSMKVIFVSECPQKHEDFSTVYTEAGSQCGSLHYFKRGIREWNIDDLEDLMKEKGYRSYYSAALHEKSEFCTVVEKAILEVPLYDGYPKQVTKEFVNAMNPDIMCGPVDCFYKSWMTVVTANGEKHFVREREAMFDVNAGDDFEERLLFNSVNLLAPIGQSTGKPYKSLKQMRQDPEHRTSLPFFENVHDVCEYLVSLK